MFFKADVQEGYHIKNCLEQYKKASGQMVDFEKSIIIKEQNIGNYGYISTSILQKYEKIWMDILIKISVMQKLTKIL